MMKLSALAAPLNENGWERMGTRGRDFAAGTAKTAGWSYPMMMSSPAPFKFIISPGETAIISQYRDIRYIYTDGRSHEPEDELWPTPWGDSIGCWEGDTLTIETIGVRYAPDYTGIGPPVSENARFVERLRLAAPDRLEAEFTITDPATLEEPWHVRMVYLRHPVLQRLVHDGDTLENDRTDGARATIAPAADGAATGGAPTPSGPQLSVAELDRLVGTYGFDEAPLRLLIERRNSRLFYRVDPVLPDFIPLEPDGPLSFSSRAMGGTFRFTTDEDGRVVGFSGSTPDGIPIAGKRVSE